jgi:hypothetical protein
LGHGWGRNVPTSGEIREPDNVAAAMVAEHTAQVGTEPGVDESASES